MFDIGDLEELLGKSWSCSWPLSSGKPENKERKIERVRSILREKEEESQGRRKSKA